MKKEYIIAAILLVTAGFAVGYIANQDSIEDTEFYNISDDKKYSPTFSVCHIQDFNQTGYFYADNLSECKQMHPDKFAY